jgi:hypothetical protein
MRDDIPESSQKAQLTADEMSEIYISEYILNDKVCPILDAISDEQRDDFLIKCKLYRVALLFMVLMNEEKKTPKLLSVRIEIEKRFFSEQNAVSNLFLEHLRGAMCELQALIFPKKSRKELSWAKSCLDAVGITDLNPAHYCQFAINWMDQYIMIRKSLDDFEIL